MLKTKHLFSFIRMIRALKIKEELKEIIRSINENPGDLEKLDEEKGLDLFFMFVEKLPDAENEVMDFLAVFTERPRSEIEELDIEELWSILKEIFTDPKLKVFFQQALK